MRREGKLEGTARKSFSVGLVEKCMLVWRVSRTTALIHGKLNSFKNARVIFVGVLFSPMYIYMLGPGAQRVAHRTFACGPLYGLGLLQRCAERLFWQWQQQWASGDSHQQRRQRRHQQRRKFVVVVVCTSSRGPRDADWGINRERNDRKQQSRRR